MSENILGNDFTNSAFQVPAISIDKPTTANQIKEVSGNTKEINLISADVQKAISGELVKSIMIPDDFEIISPNYVIDFRKVDQIRKHQLMALSEIVSDEGDTAIYVMLKNGMEFLGMGISTRLDDVLPVGVQSIFNNKCRVFQDVERDKPLREIKQLDTRKARLKL